VADFAGPGLKMVGNIAGAFGAMSAGDAAGAQGDLNAALFRRQAEVARERGRINGQRTRREGEQLQSRIVQAFGSSGVDANEGSALDVMGAHAAENEWRALLAEWEGESEAGTLDFQSSMARYRGQLAKQSAYGKAVGMLMGAGAAGFDMIDLGGFGGGGDGAAISGASDSGWGMTDWAKAAASMPVIP